jgi:Sortase and related acyltransferases
MSESVKTCRFVKMSEEYLPEVLAIYNYYVKNDTATFHIDLLNLEEMRPIVFFDNPKYQTFLIFKGDDLCGYVLLTQYKKREAYDGTAEVTIYLKPECTGCGIGSEALQHIENFARQANFHSLISIICGENNSSIRLFEKNGYQKCAHFKEVGQKFGRWLDVVDYQKMI